MMWRWPEAVEDGLGRASDTSPDLSLWLVSAVNQTVSQSDDSLIANLIQSH